MKALVVVSDNSIREEVSDFFSSRRHKSLSCGVCDEATRALEQYDFQYVIIDLTLEDDPIELCRRARVAQSDAYILVVPEEDTPAQLRTAFEAGADDYIARPLTVSALQLRLVVGERSLAIRRKSKQVEGHSSMLDRRYRTLVQHMNEGIFQVDQEGRIELVNTRMSSLTGYKVEELVGQIADDLLIEQEFRQRLPGQTLLAPEIGSEEHTLPLITKDGDRAWVKLIAVPLRLPDGALGALGIVQDISEQRNAEEDLRHKEEYFRALLESSTDLISIIDIEGQILYQSPSSLRTLGAPPELMLGQPLADFVHPEDRELLYKAIDQVLTDQGLTASAQARFRNQDGDWRYLDCQCKNLVENPVLGGIIVTSRDITERRKVEAALKRERAFFQQLFRNSPAGIVILDNQDRVVDANSSFVDLFQFEVSELAGQPLSDLIVPDDLKQEATELTDLVLEHQTVDRESERLRKDGTKVDVAILGYPIELAERKIGAYGIYSDITERKSFERKLFHEAFHDSLTGLPNRTLLTERLERSVRRAKRRRDYQFALLFIDLDRFKVINDSLGHAAGDELLIEMARRLENCLRPGDTVARLGGDEFNIILEDIQEVADATRIADRILNSLSRPFSVADQEVVSSGSIGIAFSFSGYDSGEDLMRDADIAMYRAKSRGKARYEIFDADMHKSAVERLNIENELRKAIANDELELFFQPIVSLTRSQTVGFEALVRWQHPEKGLLPPGDWLPICEETGLMSAVGRWVARRACLQIQAWQQEFPESDGVALSINLAPNEISHPDFLHELNEILEESQAHPASLTLEITEDAIADSENLQDVLWHLKKMGFRLSLDDFGTGPSSLSSLHRYPIDHLKIHRSFIQEMSPGGENLEIVRAIAALGESLGINVIAVGIEDEDRLEEIRSMGIALAQGFYFSAPLSADEATESLRQSLEN